MSKSELLRHCSAGFRWYPITDSSIAQVFAGSGWNTVPVNLLLIRSSIFGGIVAEYFSKQTAMRPALFTCLVAALLVTACTGTSKTSTEVTRYHLDQPIEPRSVFVEVSNAAEGSNNQLGDYGEIVAAELTALGFTPAAEDDSELVALVNVRQYTQEKLPQRSPVSIGIGGGSYGGNVGVGVGTSIPVGSSKSSLVNFVELKVDLAEKSDSKTVWEGTAVRELQPGIVDRSAVVKDLAAALFKGFPGESGKTVKLKQ